MGAAMAAMRAVQEYTEHAQIASIDGWLVAGASKRGWTTWNVGAVNCPSCPKIVGIAPIVPIAPAIKEGLHHMWQAYGNWTFAFQDYLDVNLTRQLDDPGFEDLLRVEDPVYFMDRLENIPKMVIVSSDDEFMMMEWTRLWWDRLQGEKHLLIANNAEHSMATGIVQLLESIANFANSVFQSGTRPTFDFDINMTSGVIEVRIPKSQAHGKVVLRHAKTLSSKRRDFRWAAAPDASGNCKAPTFKVKSLCAQPIVWTGTTLDPDSAGVYRASIPAPEHGWAGLFVEVYFPSDTGLKTEYQFTTTGLVWPQTLPFPDCHGRGCEGGPV